MLPPGARVVDIDLAASFINNNAASVSQGLCARYVRLGLEAGGLSTAGRPGSAKDYGPFLTSKNAIKVTLGSEKPQKGDLAVFGGNSAHIHGHIQMFTGRQWVSDFKQNNFSPYSSNIPPVTIWRLPH